MSTPVVSRLRLLALLVLTAAGVLWTAARADDDKEEEKKLGEKEINRLIDLLGDDDEDKRAEAEKKLIEHGEETHSYVAKAAKSHLDADVKLRATLLEKKIARGAFRELKNMLGHKEPIRDVAVTKDGKKALTCGEDMTIRVWDLGTGKEVKVIEGHQGFTWQLGLTADEKEVISSGGPDKTLRLWDLESGKEVKKYTGFGTRAYAAAVSPDGKWVVGGEGGVGADDEKGDPEDAKFDVLLFNKESGKLEHRMKGHTGYVWRAAFSPDSKKVATAGMNDNSFRIWDVATGKALVEKKDAHDNWVTGVVFVNGGKQLLTCARHSDGNKANEIKLWDAETGKLEKTFENLADDCEAIAVSKDGKRLLATAGKVVVLFDLDTGKIIHRFEEHTEPVTAVAFTPDGKKALSAGKDKTLRLWKLPK